METKQELLDFVQWIQDTPKLYQENDGWSFYNLEITNEMLVEMYMKHKQI
jgi:hypothetical protein